VAWVPQRPHLFAASLAENIRLGSSRPGTDASMLAAATDASTPAAATDASMPAAATDASMPVAATDASVRAAAADAHLDEVVDALPDGLETVLGERGHGLSSGQRQRVALARAFLRDAPLLLLDEPTARLDGGSEALILDATRHLAEGRTALLVAHRPALLAGADRVLRVDGGRVTELTGASEARAGQTARQAPSRPAEPVAPLPRSVPAAGGAG
jgi:ATP-binding cassette subfamily C protein CydD